VYDQLIYFLAFSSIVFISLEKKVGAESRNLNDFNTTAFHRSANGVCSGFDHTLA